MTVAPPENKPGAKVPVKKTRKQALQGEPAPSPGPSTPQAKAVSGVALNPAKVERRQGHSVTDERSYGEEMVDGEVVSTTSHERSLVKGDKSTISYDHMVSDGATTTSTEAEATSVAGVEAAIKTVQTYSPSERTRAVEMLARAGWFGEASASKAIKRGMAEAKLEAKGSAGAGIEAKLEAQAKVDRSGAIPAYLVMMEAAFKAGLWVDGSASAEAKLGPLAATLSGEFSALVGAEGSLSAKAFASVREGIGGEFEASAFAGARASAKGSLVVGVPNKAQIELGAEAEVMAGARASVEGGLRISLTGVSAKFEAEAFAGVEAKASGSASIVIRGKKVFSAKGTVKVQAGVGAEAEGEFTMIDGKVKFSAGLAMTLGIGGGADVDAEVDFGAIADLIYAEIWEMSKSTNDPSVTGKSPDYKREPLTNPVAAAKMTQTGYDAVYESFVAYATKKNTQGSGVAESATPGASRSDEHIKKSRVEAIIKNVAPMLRSEFAYVETDKGIEQAALEAFDGYVTHISVQAGEIRGWEVAERGAAIENRNTKAIQIAKDNLQNEVNALCRTDVNKATGAGISIKEVQKVVTKHHKVLKPLMKGADDAAKGSAADTAIGEVCAEMALTYLTSFSVKDGVVDAVVSPAKVKDAKGKQANRTSLTGLSIALDQYLAEVVKNAKLVDVDGVGVTKAVTSSTKSISSTLSDPTVAADVEATIMERLGRVVTSAKLLPGGTVLVTPKVGGVEAVRADQAARAGAAKQAVATKNFTTALSAYLDTKLSGGKNAVKSLEVQKLVDRAYKEGGWPPTALDAADTALMGAAKEAMGAMLRGDDGVLIQAGRLKYFDLDITKFKTTKENRAKYGVAKIEDGEDNDNSRRKLIADAMRDPLIDLTKTLRSEAAEELPTGGTVTPLTREWLQSVVDDALSDVLADAMSAVGDDALADALLIHVPLLESVEVNNLQLLPTTVIDNQFFQKQYAGAKQSQAVRDVEAQVAKDLATLTATSATLQTVQAAVTAGKKALTTAGVPVPQHDVLLANAVRQALKAILAPDGDAVVITNGKVGPLSFKGQTPPRPSRQPPPPVPSRQGRPPGGRP